MDFIEFLLTSIPEALLDNIEILITVLLQLL